MKTQLSRVVPKLFTICALVSQCGYGIMVLEQSGYRGLLWNNWTCVLSCANWFTWLVAETCWSDSNKDGARHCIKQLQHGKSAVPPFQQTEEIQQCDREVALWKEDHSEPAESIVESEPSPQIEEQVVIPENVMLTPPRVQQTWKVPAYLKNYVTDFKGPKEKQWYIFITTNCFFIWLNGCHNWLLTRLPFSIFTVRGLGANSVYFGCMPFLFIQVWSENEAT